MSVSEARSEGGKIYLNGWFRVVVGIIVTLVIGTTAYAYVIILPRITEGIIENDRLSRQRDADINKRITENRILIAELTSIKTKLESIENNQTEFKTILKRTAPYERKL